MSELATNAPVASKFVFLHDIGSLAPATKIRFLGCIVDYHTAEGRLLLEHAYPKDTHPVPRVSVDINLVLESLQTSILRSGTWINVIGYTRDARPHGRKRKKSMSRSDEAPPSVQAILIWDAGALRLRDYEITLEEQRQVQRQLETHCK